MERNTKRELSFIAAIILVSASVGMLVCSLGLTMESPQDATNPAAAVTAVVGAVLALAGYGAIRLSDRYENDSEAAK